MIEAGQVSLHKQWM